MGGREAAAGAESEEVPIAQQQNGEWADCPCVGGTRSSASGAAASAQS